MTIKEFHINFNIELDKTLDFEYAYIQPEQIDYWLNKAVDRLITDIVSPEDPREKTFEETQDRIEEIRTLVRSSGPITPVKTGTVYRSFLPTDYMYKVRHSCIASSSCGSKKVGGNLTKQVYLNNMLKDPFWTPSSEEPLYVILGEYIEYETLGRFEILSTDITYIRTPATMRLGTEYSIPTTDVQCDLPEWSHIKILSIAVSMVLENIQSQRYQTNLNELNKIT